MSAFAPTQAALEGFRVAGRRPGAVLILGLFYALLAAGLGWACWSLFGRDLTFLTSIEVGSVRGASEADRVVAVARRVVGLYALVVPVLLVVQAMVLCQVYRAVLRPAERGFGGLRLGGDEFRMLGLLVLLTLLMLAVVAVAVGLIGAVALWALHQWGRPAAIAVACALGFLAEVGLIRLALGLSLAGPMTFAERRIRLFGSLALTRGRIWPLLGMVLLATLLAVAVSTFASFFTQPAIALVTLNYLHLGQGGVSAAAAPEPLALGFAALLGLIGCCIYALVAFVSRAPLAAAYAALTAPATGAGEAPAA